MTNRKLKLAAMSVALTACVAAQPMAAHAVEGPDANADDTATPQAGPAAMDPVDDTGSTAADATDGEEEKQEEFTPPVNDEAVATDRLPAFGPDTKTDDITIDYKPAEKPEEPGDAGDTDNTGDTGNTGDAGDAGDTDDTDDTKKPDGTYMEGDVIDNSKKDETTGEDGKIGTATKEETPESSSSTTVVDPDAEVKKGESVVGKDEDGNTTITTPTETTGTETTTTTGTGTAKSDTTITDTKETEKGDKIDLDEELKNKDGVVENPTWDTKEKDKLGDYTVEGVETTEGDPDSKDLTLKKTEDDKKEMSAEDIAKLLDVSKDGVEKETDAEGNTTYTLTKTETSTDENGNTVTRTTYYKITGNTVETHTETKLIIRVTKGTEKGEQDVTETPVLPDFITVKNDKGELKVSKEILEKALASKDGTYTDGDLTYKVTEKEVSSTKLSNKELAESLGDDFTYNADDDSISYKGEKLTISQNEVYRKLLSYDVTVTETIKTPGQTTADPDEVEKAAKLEAIRNALRKAAVEAGIDTTGTDFEAKLDAIDSTDANSITFKYTKDGIEHEVTFNYDGATANVSSKEDGKEEVTDNTVTGTAYVTSGSESWSQSGNFTGNVPYLSGDFKTANGLPAGGQITSVDANGRITEITYKNDKGEDVKYTFTYRSLNEKELADLKADLAKKGYELNLTQGLTVVEWTEKTVKATSTTTTDKKKSNIDLSGNKLVTEVPNEDGSLSYTIKVNGKELTGFTKNSDGTYTRTDAKGETTTITVTQTNWEDSEITSKLRTAYNVADGTAITLSEDANGKYATWTNADKSVVKVYYTGGYTESLTVTEKKDHNLNATEVDQLVSQVQKKMEGLSKGDQVILTGNSKKITIICLGNNMFEIRDDETGGTITDAVWSTAVETKLGKVIEKIAQNTSINYDKLTGEDIWNLLDIQQVYGDSPNGSEFASGTDSYWPEAGYENIGEKKDGTTYGENFRPTTNFDSISLDAEVSIAGKDANGNDITYNGVLLNDADNALSFEYGHKEEIAGWVDMSKYPDQPSGNYNKKPGSWGYQKPYDKDELHTTDTVTKANLADSITMTDGSVWNKDKYGSNVGGYDTGKKLVYACEGNTLTGKGFYNVSGKVAYDEAGRSTDYMQAEILLAKVQEEAKKNGSTLCTAKIVALPNKNGGTDYVVYRNVTTVNAIGYMTASANTNYESNSDQNRNYWTPGSGVYSGSTNPGGYDLRIQGLQLVDGKVQGNYGVKYGLDMSVIKSYDGDSSNTLTTGAYTTTINGTKTETTGHGSDKYGSYTASYTKDYNWKDETSQGVEGKGTGSYTTFTDVLKKIFTGSGKKEHDEGKVSYSYRTTDADKLETSAVSKTTTTKTEAQVDYDYTTIETRKVTVSGEETVIVPPVDPDTPDEPEIPDTPDTPVQDETPDEVVTPETPELPPVQDATPDEAVTPANPELPAVQDATALPQTGVNWFTALGMAFSGMLLMIAGAFTSLKYKEKH